MVIITMTENKKGDTTQRYTLNKQSSRKQLLFILELGMVMVMPLYLTRKKINMQ